MARATKLPVFDVSHRHVICPGTHLEADLGMAHRTIEADAMKPVREYHRTHA
jgi:hypothetical protein